MAEETYSPMIQHYLSVKKEYPYALLFYRIGDFYEMFFDDAKIASSELDLVLTGKNGGVEERIPMCGVPHHAVNSYIQRLVARGYKVAIVEQMEDPALAKGLVQRDVIRVVTPGTVMDELGSEKDSVYLAAVVDCGYAYALAVLEMSTGETYLLEIARRQNLLLQTILKNSIREIVVHPGFDEKAVKMLRETPTAISYCEQDTIKDLYLPLAEGIKKEQDRQAYGLLLNYLEATQKQACGHLQVVRI